MSNDLTIIIILCAYIVIREILWTYKELQLLDRALPRNEAEHKAKTLRQILGIGKSKPPKPPKSNPLTYAGESTNTEGKDKAGAW